MKVVLVLQKRKVTKKHVKKVIHDLIGVANTNISVSWNQQREYSLLQTYV